jgi:hypothetical protein
MALPARITRSMDAKASSSQSRSKCASLSQTSNTVGKDVVELSSDEESASEDEETEDENDDEDASDENDNDDDDTEYVEKSLSKKAVASSVALAKIRNGEEKENHEGSDDEDENDLSYSNLSCLLSDIMENQSHEIPDEILTGMVLYCFRIFMRQSGEYFYKVGYTDGKLLNRMRQIHDMYDSCGRIIPVLFARVPRSYNEYDVHRELIKFRADVHLIRKQSNPRELYVISSECNEAIENAFKKYSAEGSEVWDSWDYIIDEENGDREYIDLGDDEEQDLDQGEKESAYWLQKRIEHAEKY